MFYLATPAKLLERAYFFKQSENDDCEDQELGKAPTVPSVEGAGPNPGHGHGRRLRAGLWRLGARVSSPPAQGGAWEPDPAAPVRGLAFPERVRGAGSLPWKSASGLHRPAPLAQPALSSTDPDRGSQPAIVILPGPQWGHSGTLQRPLREGTSSPSGVPLAAAFACVGGYGEGGVWLWRKQLAARGNVTEDWII